MNSGAPGQEHVEEVRFLRACITESLGKLETKIQKLTALLKAYLPSLAPGRPHKETVTLALEMRNAGKKWPRIYRACLRPRAFYDSEEAFSRAKRSLRNAVALRQARAKQSGATEDEATIKAV